MRRPLPADESLELLPIPGTAEPAMALPVVARRRPDDETTRIDHADSEEAERVNGWARREREKKLRRG